MYVFDDVCLVIGFCVLSVALLWRNLYVTATLKGSGMCQHMSINFVLEVSYSCLEVRKYPSFIIALLCVVCLACVACYPDIH